MYRDTIETWNPCGCGVEIEITYDCECCGTGYGGFKLDPCEAHKTE